MRRATAGRSATFSGARCVRIAAPLIVRAHGAKVHKVAPRHGDRVHELGALVQPLPSRLPLYLCELDHVMQDTLRVRDARDSAEELAEEREVLGLPAALGPRVHELKEARAKCIDGHVLHGLVAPRSNVTDVLLPVGFREREGAFRRIRARRHAQCPAHAGKHLDVLLLAHEVVCGEMGCRPELEDALEHIGAAREASALGKVL
mmetsp:Transcript_14775/g.43385  ORF Transcript_14775/g.43385 Transcript_14775/m.43385 type:complete len:204 (-) Transcript_14775:257-868(-)